MLPHSIKFMKDMIEAVEEEPEREAPCTIYRVLETIREQDPRAYDPKIIPIGPFHQRDLFQQHDRASQPVERLKWRFLRDLIRRHTSNSVGRDEFLAMMVLDGCFIIEYLAKAFHGMEGNVHMYFEHWDIRLLRNDLLMLENQIPFSVLQCLFNSTEIPTLPADMTLKVLAVKCFTHRTDFLNFIPDEVHHLLHLFHSCFRPSSPSSTTPCVSGSLSGSFFWMLSFLIKYQPPAPPVERALRMIPRATELDEAGVKFKIKKDTRIFLDVTFRKGIMEIPFLRVESLTVSFFRNLIAFERCCPESERHMTSYAALMDSLIDKPEDVALLERSGVLQNMLLGGAEEMVRFYNSLGKAANLDYDHHYMANLFKEVTKYYGNERHRWRVKIMRNFALLAFVLFVFSFLQTFFAVFAYFCQPFIFFTGAPRNSSRSENRSSQHEQIWSSQHTVAWHLHHCLVPPSSPPSSPEKAHHRAQFQLIQPKNFRSGLFFARSKPKFIGMTENDQKH